MDYSELTGLPALNGVTVIGDKTLEDYGLVPITTDDIDEIMLEEFGYLL